VQTARGHGSRRSFRGEVKIIGVPRRSVLLLVSLAGTVIVAGIFVARSDFASPSRITAAPVELTAEQDHQRLLDLLRISLLRAGPDADRASVHAANYDESKANPYPKLPDPLVLENGEKVATAAVWWKRRRPRIVEDFDREIYGREPKRTPAVKWEIASTAREKIGGVAAITKKLVGHVDNSSYPAISVEIQASLTIPAESSGRVPVMMEFGLDPAVMRRLREQMEARGQKFPPPPPGPTWQEQVLAKGWGYAVIIPTSYQDDNGAGLTRGIIGLCNQGQSRKLDDWGALRAWAWGASRLLNYLETDKAVDAKRVGIEGLSRYGKAALVTMAYDQRFAIALVGSSGAGGAKLLRRNFGETVENLAATSEYHWFAGNFLKYAGPLTANDLPVDAHELIAMAAPRPVFISCGSPQVEGGWVDDKGQFMAEVAAGPVYELLGKKGLGTTEMPPIGNSLMRGDLAFRQHEGGHTDGPNWPAFLRFGSRYMGGLAHFEGN